MTAAPLVPLLRPLQRGIATIIMLHRFADPGLRVHGHDPDLISRCLRFLHARRFRIRSTLELIEAARAGEDISRSVAFTIDDGYIDFDSVGGSVFTDLDAPVTVFVPTGVVDKSSWFWWDRVVEALNLAPPVTIQFELGDSFVTLRTTDSETRDLSANALILGLKQLPDAELKEAVDRLVTTLRVDLPPQPPPNLSVMGWDAIRSWAERGVEFGPHTVGHVILGRLRHCDAEREIASSWHRLREQIPRAVPLFCYPNGQPGDFSSALYPALADHGLAAAVTAVPGYLTARGDGAVFERFAVPRFAMPETFHEFKSIVLGVERVAAVASSGIWR